MSESLLNVHREFLFRGARYVLAKRDIYIEAQFCTWAAATAALTLERLRKRIPAEFFAEQMRLYNDKVCGQKFQWESPDVLDASTSVLGQRELLFLKLKRGAQLDGEDLERELIDEIAGNAEKYAELLNLMYQQDYPDFFAELTETAKTSPSPSSTSPAAIPASSSANP